MNYSNIFPLSLEGASPIFPIIGSLFGALFYAALFQFGYNRIIQKLYAQTVGWKVIYRVQIYLYLVNLPYIALILQGIIFNNSLLPFQTALKIDQIYILIICGYICFLQESRQTPIRGFVVIKDSFFILIGLAILSDLYTKGVASSQYLFTIVPVYLVSLIIQVFTNEIQQCLLLALRIKQKNIYRSSFLLTEKSLPSSFLEIKDIISTHEEDIQQEIQDFVAIATRLKRSNQELTILINFAKLFIPIKKAYEINEQANSKEIHDQFVRSWQKIQHDYLYQRQRDGDDDTEKVYSFNNSASTLLIKKTFTTDSLLDQEGQKEAEQSFGFKVLKYLFYPLYLSTTITGRLRYFMDYLIVLSIFACMFLLSNSIAYFSFFFASSENLISLIYAGLLFYPIAKYFIKISQGSNDYDFLGIFMQGMTLKVAVFALGLAISSAVNASKLIESGKSDLISLIIRIATIGAYCAFLGWKRFAMRFDNLKAFVFLFTFSQIFRIIQEEFMDNMGGN